MCIPDSGYFKRCSMVGRFGNGRRDRKQRTTMQLSQPGAAGSLAARRFYPPGARNIPQIRYSGVSHDFLSYEEDRSALDYPTSVRSS